MKRVILVLILTVSLFIDANSQVIFTNDSPKRLLTKDKILTVNTQPTDVQTLLAEDQVNPRPFRVGVIDRYGQAFKEIATKVEFKDLNVWYLAVHSDDAAGLGFVFDNMQLPRGAKLFFYTPDGKYYFGPVTYLNNKESGILATKFLKGRDYIIEYQEPKDLKEKNDFNLRDIVIYYRNPKGVGASGSCNVNINCPEGSAWQTEKRAVAKYTFESGLYVYTCTGALIANTAQSDIPYFLTANHCVSKDKEAESAVFYFNFESIDCEGTTYTDDQTISGATLVSMGQVDGTDHLDFTLMKLSLVPPFSYSPYYAGWSRVSVAEAIDSSVTIHHPSGDLKKISKDFDSPGVGSFSGYDSQTHWQIYQWDLGTTEGGSSGAPLFDQNKRIIGDLTGGEADCDNSVNDFYAQFFHSWDDFADSAAQLRVWLDPLGFNPVAFDGYDPYQYIDTSLTPVRKIMGYSHGTTARIFWLAPNTLGDSVFYDGFENYKDFDLTIPLWTQYDLDTAITWGVEGLKYPNENYIGSFIVFNPSKTDPKNPLGWNPHSGEKYLACFSAQDKPNNDWLVTPGIDIVNGSKLVFYAKSVSNLYNLEKIRVLVSANSSNPADFVPLTQEPVTVPDKWTRYEFDLSSYAGSRLYIAINVVSDSSFSLLLDDFSVSPYPGEVLKTAGTDLTTRLNKQKSAAMSHFPKMYSPQLKSYDIYRDFIYVTTVSADTTFYTETLPDTLKQHSYYVVANYDSSSAIPSPEVSLKYQRDTATDFEHDNTIQVYPNPGLNGYFTIEFNRPVTTGILRIYDLSGKPVLIKDMANIKILHVVKPDLAPGTYIIRLETPKEVYKTMYINL